MIKNYLKTALRNLYKHKGYSLINILGLAIGMASCLMILMYVNHELSYDSFNEKADRIFRVSGSFRWGGRDFDIAVNAAPVAQTLINDFPEVEDAVRFRQRGRYVVKYGDKSFRERNTSFADASFFNIFSIPLLKGDPQTALAAPKTLVLSRDTAEKYFRDEDPIGKTLKINDREDYQVTGVYENIPDNSHFHFDILFSMESLQESKGQIWLSQNFQTYIVLRDGADYLALEAKFPDLIIKYMGPQLKSFLGKTMEEVIADGELRAEFYLQPLTSIHLHSDLLGEMEATSDAKYVYIFSAIALFILLIAAVNFMNLATARSANRAREVGIRKVLGSYRKQLIGQFLTESMVLSFLAMLLALGLVSLALPLFNNLAGKDLVTSLLGQDSMPLLLVLMTLLTGFLAGSYPAFFISAFRPVNVLKGKMKTGAKSGMLRSVMVVFQFASSIILIVGTFVVYNQLHYMQNKKLGYEKEQVLMLENTYLLGNQIQAFKEAVLANPQFVSGTVSGYLPVPSNRSNNATFPEGEINSDKATSMQQWDVDFDFIKTLGIKIVAGRDFSREFSTDTSAAIINQAVAKHFEWADPVGKRLGRGASNDGKVDLYEVIGVVEDFHFESLRDTIGPLILFLGDSRGMISFRIETDDVSATIGALENNWQEFLPDQPFEYSFLDDRFDAMYRSEQRIGKIFGVFAGLAIFIGCLGLFGLAAFTAEQRTKEIGVRKILGASVPNITRLLLKEFTVLIGIANIVAWPIAFFIMRMWLQDFSYQTSLGLWIFLAAGLMTLFIAIFTVSFQAIKAALADPINSLRYE